MHALLFISDQSEQRTKIRGSNKHALLLISDQSEQLLKLYNDTYQYWPNSCEIWYNKSIACKIFTERTPDTK